MRERIKDVYIVLIIVLIGVLVRLPIGNISTTDVSILHDPDSFLYERLATEFYEKPISEWSIFTSRSIDPIMNTVNENNDPFTTNLLPIIVALICKAFKSIDINVAIYYFNTILCPLSAIPTYIFVKKYSNRLSAIVAGMAMSLSASYFLHTMHGYFDTDAIIMVLATTAVLCHINSFLENSMWKQFVSSGFAILALVLFYFSWEAYYAYGAIMLALSLVLIISNKLCKSKLKLLAPSISSFVILAFCVLTSGQAAVGSLGRTISTMLHGSKWPDESSFIGELKTPKLIAGGLNNSFLINPIGVINWIGGLPLALLLLASLSMLLWFVLKKTKNEGVPYNKLAPLFVSLLVWFVITVAIVPFGIRFVQLMALPVNLIVGFGAGLLFDRFQNCDLKKFDKDILVILVSILFFGSTMFCNFWISLTLSLIMLFVGMISSKVNFKSILIVFLVIVFVDPIVCEYFISKNSAPFVSKDLVKAMNYVAENTDEDSLLVSWWSYGYFFEYATRRQVVSDGGIYDGAYFYWLANVFTTEDEELSIGISRMLQSGSIEPVYLAESYLADARTATEMLKKILVIDKDSAVEIMKKDYKLSQTQADKILAYTHPDMVRDAYYIIYDELSDDASPIAYFGLWNFVSDKFYETKYNSEDKKYTYPDELENSVLLKLLNEDDVNNFDVVYSNNTVRVYKVNSIDWGISYE